MKVDFLKVGCIRDKTWECGLKSEHCHVLLQIKYCERIKQLDNHKTIWFPYCNHKNMFIKVTFLNIFYSTRDI